MFQLIARQTVADPILKQRRLADPDLLLHIVNSARFTQDRSLQNELSNLFSQVLHDLRMGGAWKRTGSRRLVQTERTLQQHLPPARHGIVNLLDLGASDGITSLSCSAHFGAPDMVSSAFSLPTSISGFTDSG